MNLFIILGNQLFPESHFKPYKKNHHFFMSESLKMCNKYKYHKKKLLFLLTSMRIFAQNLKDKNYDISYNKIGIKDYDDFYPNLRKLILKYKVKKIKTFEILNKNHEIKMKKFVNDNGLDWEIIDSPMFINNKKYFKEFLSNYKKPLMVNFYKSIRKKLNLLVDIENKPLGGKWSFDEENRKKLPKNIEIPQMPRPKKNKELDNIIKLVDVIFKDNPGDTKNFWLSTDHKGAEHALKSFLENKINLFGDYEDAVSTRDSFLFHSAISPYMNIGLITPELIIKKVIEHSKKNNIKLNSLEGFIRQIVGWREFIKGIYDNFSVEMNKNNFFNHTKNLTDSWYEGTTGLLPLDHTIRNVKKNAWSHHIERLMILSNIMNLCEIKPKNVFQWFMEMYVDAYEWVMEPNVYGMGLFSDGGIFATKPYICGSNYFIKMMDFKKGEWCDILDGLYWRFIDKNQKFFKGNPRLSLMTKTLQKINPNRKEKIFNLAEEFIEQNTN